MRSNPPPRQQGIALIITLFILLTLTLISASAMQTALLEEKIAANAIQHKQAFEHAEAALQAGENWLRDNQSPLDVGVTINAEQYRITLLHRRKDRLDTIGYGDQTNTTNDYYLIENQVSDHASGVQVILQSIYVKRY